jgi:hypothetical protein
MIEPLFIATKRFDPSDREKWRSYCEWAKIPGLEEIVSLDGMLCEPLITEFEDADWSHMVNENFRLGYFYHLDYLKGRVRDVVRRNILGLYRNPETPIESAPAPESFIFIGHDLIEEQTGISALTNCGGFPDVFSNEGLRPFGLIKKFDRASEVKQLLAKRHPKEPHAQCELYAIWRLNE